MPLAKRKEKKLDPDGIYRAWQPAAIGSLPGVPVVQTGARYRGDDPRVQAAPHLFVRDGTDDSEVADRWAEEFGEVTAEVRRSGEPRVEPVHSTPALEPVRVKDLVVAIRSLEVETEEGRWEVIRAGTTVAKDRPAVETHSDAFVEVNPEGLARNDALVTLETMSNTDESGDVTVVHQGQWISRRHPFVRVHPYLFDLPRPEYV